MNESKFTGSMFGLIGVRIVSFFITLFTLGIGFPWAIAYKQRWIVKNQTIDGNRLMFTGTGAQLFGNYIKWLLLSMITLGIYALWLPIKIQQWVTKHTHIYHEQEAHVNKNIVINASDNHLSQSDVKNDFSISEQKHKQWRLLSSIVWIVMFVIILVINIRLEIGLTFMSRYLPAIFSISISIIFIVLLAIYLLKKQNLTLLILTVSIGVVKIVHLDYLLLSLVFGNSNLSVFIPSRIVVIQIVILVIATLFSVFSIRHLQAMKK